MNHRPAPAPAPRSIPIAAALWVGPLGGSYPATDADAAAAALRVLFPETTPALDGPDGDPADGIWIVLLPIDSLDDADGGFGFSMAAVDAHGIAARIEIA